MKLADATVVITGAGSGLGKELALQCGRGGAHVVVSDRIKSRSLEEVAKASFGISFVADVTHEEAVQDLARAAVEHFGGIHVWINNAGMWVPHAPFEKFDATRMHKMFEVNVFGTMYGSREAFLRMKKQNSGVLVNILSTSALEGRAGSALYCASKYAAKGFTKSIQLEAKNIGVYVVAVYPGLMQTNLFDEQKPEDFRAYMDPSDVAQKIISHISEETPREELIIRE